MDLFRESRYVMHLLVCCLGCLCGLAFGQVSEAFTGSANFSSIELTCIANLAAFVLFTLRGKYWCGYVYDNWKMRQKCLKPKNINGLEVLTTCRGELQECSVVMLSFQMPTLLTVDFMSYMSNAYDVHSIFLPCRPIGPVEDSVQICTDACTENQEGGCGCIVFNTEKDITMMLARRMPGTVKRLSDSLSLLPSLRCLRNGCHGCNQGLLHVENDRLRDGDSQVESPAAVCEILSDLIIHKVSTGICICIPVRSANDDEWTNQLMKRFKPDEEEFRGAVIRKGRTNASSALENYKNGRGECEADEKYNLASLSIVPGLTHALINLVLTFWLKVDGFSSKLFAITASERLPGVKYVHMFLSRARIQSNTSKSNVCQVLFFRHGFQSWLRPDSLLGTTTWICAVSWVVLVALEGGANKWYHTHSVSPSSGRVAVILVGICIAVVMDGFDLILCLEITRLPRSRGKNHRKIITLICAIIVVEVLCIVSCSAIAGVMGIKAFGRWIYSALQCLAFLKCIIAVNHIVPIRPNSISQDSPEYEELPWWFDSCGLYIIKALDYILPIRPNSLSQDSPEYEEVPWWYDSCGLYIGSSTVLLNAILAGVRAKWQFEQ